jgi:acetyltransferase-like isoleucine patch superfamily enzyme
MEKRFALNGPFSISGLPKWAAVSDHWAAAGLRRMRSGHHRISLPMPHIVAKVILALYVASRGVIKFLVRVLISQPCFMAYCTSCGKRLTTTWHLPWVRGIGRIVIGDDVTIHGRITIAFAARYAESPTLTIGDGTGVGHHAVFVIGKQITVGKNCLISNEVIMFDAPGHPTSAPLRLQGAPAATSAVKPITIGDNVWIGQRGIVYPGVTIGEGAVVATGSVVMNDVEAHTMVGGNPARRISYADLSKIPKSGLDI